MTQVKTIMGYTHKLTEADLELIKQLCLPQKIACHNLQITLDAFGVRVFRLMNKLGVENKTALAVKAVQLRIVELNEFQLRKF